MYIIVFEVRLIQEMVKSGYKVEEIVNSFILNNLIAIYLSILYVTIVQQLLAQGRWFTPASLTTKTGRHDIAEILLKVVLITKNLNLTSICCRDRVAQ